MLISSLILCRLSGVAGGLNAISTSWCGRRRTLSRRVVMKLEGGDGDTLSNVHEEHAATHMQWMTSCSPFGQASST